MARVDTKINKIGVQFDTSVFPTCCAVIFGSTLTVTGVTTRDKENCVEDVRKYLPLFLSMYLPSTNKNVMLFSDNKTRGNYGQNLSWRLVADNHPKFKRLYSDEIKNFSHNEGSEVALYSYRVPYNRWQAWIIKQWAILHIRENLPEETKKNLTSLKEGYIWQQVLTDIFDYIKDDIPPPHKAHRILKKYVGEDNIPKRLAAGEDTGGLVLSQILIEENWLQPFNKEQEFRQEW